MRGMHKAFDGVEVLHGVDFELRAGEVHALVGENGAGKSTLIKILGGVYADYAGDIRIAGRAVRFTRPADAAGCGIAVIHQELSLVPELTVAENLLLGREPRTRLGWLDRRAALAAVRHVIEQRLGIALDPQARVGALPIGLQQMVEIGKALLSDTRILVMDEPTSALNEDDVRRLFALIAQLKATGVGLIYISHKMDEIYQLADRITVLRDGAQVGSAPAASLPLERLIELMVGRAVEQRAQRGVRPPGPKLLEVRGLTVRLPGARRPAAVDVSLNVHAGEIVGVAGLVGAGNSELLAGIFGRYGRPEQGTVRVAGESVTGYSPRDSLRRGVALLTNDRKADGLVLPLSVLVNMTLAAPDAQTRGGLLSARQEHAAVQPLIERLKLRAPSLGAAVATLSGGNQQKVLLARWLLTAPRALLLDEPTRGIDIGAKADVYALLDELTAAGLGILLITSELPELLGLADRIVVMHRGAVTAEFARAEATQENIVRAALGA